MKRAREKESQDDCTALAGAQVVAAMLASLVWGGGALNSNPSTPTPLNP